MADEGLLAGAEPVVEEAPVTEEGTENTEVNTTQDDGSKAVDAPVRPEWLDEQFWNDDQGEGDYEKLSKSYSDLRKAFNDKNNDASSDNVDDYITDDMFNEEGNFNVEGYQVPKDDAGLAAAFEAAKEAGLGVKQAQKFIGKFLESAKDFAPQETTLDVQAEMGKLGDNANHIVGGIKTWVDGMKNDGQINEDVHAEILKLGATANGIKALDVLRSKTGEMGLPTGQAITGSSTLSAEDWYSATFESHAESGESRDSYNKRMHDAGQKIFGNGSQGYNGAGLGTGRK